MPKQIRLSHRVTIRITPEQLQHLQSTGGEFAEYIRNLLIADMSKNEGANNAK